MKNLEKRKMAESEYAALLQVCSDKGIALQIPEPDDLKDVSDTDLFAYVRELKFLARTPT